MIIYPDLTYLGPITNTILETGDEAHTVAPLKSTLWAPCKYQIYIKIDIYNIYYL